MIVGTQSRKTLPVLSNRSRALNRSFVRTGVVLCAPPRPRCAAEAALSLSSVDSGSAPAAAAGRAAVVPRRRSPPPAAPTRAILRNNPHRC